MIIVEGPDGAGKTRLIKRIQEDYDFPLGQRGTTDREMLHTVTVPDAIRALRHVLHGDSHPPFIWDRLYFSELVYSPINGREVAFNRSERRLIEGMLRELMIPVILCMPPLEVVKANEAKDPVRSKHVGDNIERIYRQYAYGLPRGGFTFLYDYTKGDQRYYELTLHIDNYLRIREERQWTLNAGEN